MNFSLLSFSNGISLPTESLLKWTNDLSAALSRWEVYAVGTRNNIPVFLSCAGSVGVSVRLRSDLSIFDSKLLSLFVLENVRPNYKEYFTNKSSFLFRSFEIESLWLNADTDNKNCLKFGQINFCNAKIRLCLEYIVS